MSASLRIGFFVLIAFTLSALFIPDLYAILADFSLRQTGTLESIQNLDNNFALNSLADAQDIWEDIEEIFTGNDNQENDESEEDEKGFFESNLYPTLVSSISFIYRTLAIILSITGLIGIIYLSYATSGAADYQKLKSNFDKLQKRVELLEGSKTNP